MITELKTADEAERAFRYSNWFYWAPGDATKYRVWQTGVTPALGMYEHMIPVTDVDVLEDLPEDILAMVVQVADGLLRRDSLVINHPRNEWDKWCPRLWAERGFPPGWWAGIRPLLAILGWTEPEYSSREFDALDNLVFRDYE